HARLLYRSTGAWSSLGLADHTTGVVAGSAAIPAGVAQVGPSLYARHADAADGGLGVYLIALDVDGRTVPAWAPKGTALQPRPRTFGADLCVDTRLLHDGYLTGLFRASDGALAGGNAAPVVTRALRVDNTAPSLAGTAPADTPDRRPELVVRAADASSG